LNDDGTVSTETESSGMSTTVPTFTNKNVMDFARVFTGLKQQPQRANIEVGLGAGGSNMIDPMRVDHIDHDKFPKPDLKGGYLGDGVPLCKHLPKKAFLAKGARYEWVSHLVSGATPYTATGLTSALDTLLGADTGRAMTTIILDADVDCASTDECPEEVDIVKLAAGFYEYVAPTCVHHFFSNRVEVQRTNDMQYYNIQQDVHVNHDAQMEYCADAEAPVAWYACCNETVPIQLHCHSNSSQGVSLAKAQKACHDVGLSVCAPKPEDVETFRDSKCGNTSAMYLWTEKDCSDAVIEVHEDGEISAHTEHHKHTKFAVKWEDGGAPPAGNYSTTVHVEPVFTLVPSKAELMEKLSIGAFKPNDLFMLDTGNESDVKAYTKDSDGTIDKFTVFSCGHHFYVNAKSVVAIHMPVAVFSFRNPPVFLSSFGASLTPEQGSNPRKLERAVFAEVESLIDHLFHHPNVPVTIARKLIQRFVTSNPSPEYLGNVSEAFKKGTFGSDMQFSGKYGDLGATVAAIFLHDEARLKNNRRGGLLREPLLKLVHFMRSMEFTDFHHNPVALHQLNDAIGEFPYSSETVFNFYLPDFMPHAFSQGMTAPEFQIYTPPMSLTLLNGFMTIIKQGLTHCQGGFGADDGRAGTSNCTSGVLRYSAKDGDDPLATVEELDVLLTGGRLAENSKIANDAYDLPDRSVHDKVRQAQQAIVLTPEFHNLGDPVTTGFRLEPEPEPEPMGMPSATVPYKAVVMLFLAGGADTYQMIVPNECDLYDEYKEARKGMAINKTDLLPISATTQTTCQSFGIHPELPNLAQLYGSDELAFVSNVGFLVDPLRFEGLQGGHMKQCPSLFSHTHATSAAQTLQCGSATTAPKGTGGLMADALQQKNMKTKSFSVSGKAAWSQGHLTTVEIIDKSKGPIRFKNYDDWKTDIHTITSQTYGSAYCEGYAAAFGHAINSSETLSKHMSQANVTNYLTQSPLEKQLHQVARLIDTREERKAERDFFYVQAGGWDSHNQMNGDEDLLSKNFRKLDVAIKGFVDELKRMQVFDQVVLATSSEFGRTLSSNGKGTDHGWGGNHIVLGGSVNGGKVFNEFLETYAPGSPFDAGRGRVIPACPWESMMVPIAEWVGINDAATLDTIFPNLHKFQPRDSYIIPSGGPNGMFLQTGGPQVESPGGSYVEGTFGGGPGFGNALVGPGFRISANE